MSHQLCPPRATLGEFALGDLPETELDVILTHIASCPACEVELDSLDNLTDSLIDELRARVGRSGGDTTLPAPSSGLIGDEIAPAAMPENLGSLRLIREIGRGGMGIVYEAFEGSLNRHVAIKMLPDRGDLPRFRREARAAARLHHTNIVPVFGIGEYQGRHYYVMQYIEGRSLDAFLHEQQIASGERGNAEKAVREAARIGVQAAEALAYAHAQGVIHRDVKPSNILLDRAGTVWITDFGLASDATDAETLTHTGDFLGTLRYTSPERLDGRGDARADQYGLGVSLYEIACGRPVFPEKDRVKLINQVLYQDPPRPRQINPELPRDFETIVLKAMDRDPGRRYAGVSELGADLRRFLENRPIAARRTSLFERAVRWSRREPGLAAAAGSMAAALVIIAALGLLYANQKSHIARQQAAASAKIGALNVEVTRRRDDLEHSLASAKLNLAMFHFEQGRVACERGEVGPGLLYLLECWRSAIAAGKLGDAWRKTARASLALWQRRIPNLEMAFSHEKQVSSVAVSPDGLTVATASADATARIWDAATGEPRCPPLRHNGPVTSIVFAADGRSVLTGCQDGSSRLWDAASGQPKGEPLLNLGALRGVAMSADGKTAIAASQSGLATLWNITTGKPIGPPLDHHGSVVEAVAFHPDGRTVVTSNWGGTVHYWDVASGHLIGVRLSHSGIVRCIAFHPDGKVVVTACEDHKVRFWDFATGAPLGTTLSHEGAVTSLQFSRDGKKVLSASLDGTARVWDVATGNPVRPALTHQSPLLAAAFGADDTTVVTASVDGSARLWNGVTMWPSSLVLKHPNAVNAVAFSPDDKMALTGGRDGRARLWQTATGELSGAPLSHPSVVNAVSFDPSGHAVATGCADGLVRVWDVKTGREIHQFRDGTDQIVAIQFGPEGSSLATCNWDGTMRLREAMTGKPLGPAIRSPVYLHALAIARDGKTIAAGGTDGTARFWDATTGQQIGPPLKHQDGILGAAFSPDGTMLLTGCADGSASEWDCAAHTLLGPTMKHQGRVLDVAFRADGEAALTCSDDHTVRMWNVSTGQPLGPAMRHDDIVEGVCFSSDGRRVLTGSADATARIWDVSIDVPDDLDRAALAVEVQTGLTLDERGQLRALDAKAWRERRDRLGQDRRPSGAQ